MREVMRIARKEFEGFFSSPAAFLFLGAFLAVNLFVFFWLAAFFARNIADVRPLFEWMPVLLIFLVAALTMRAWSEERRTGTLEALLTAPVPPWQLVVGKFTAGVGLVALALALTLPLPITVAMMGPLDWGPVVGGYVASLFLAAAYVAIGLYMSVRTDNAIVALILTTVVGGLFFLVGSQLIGALFGHAIGGWLALLGSGSRFEAITRGVLDFRDLYYYLSIVGVFLTLNIFALERLRWAGNPLSSRHRAWGWATALLAANLVAGNFWLQHVGWARADITDGNIYSLSESTERYLERAQEPLLIRGYFSAQTHPFLSPLVPQLKDLLTEYAVAGGDNVTVEFVDPQEDQALEEEAAARFSIRPVPFQMADRYQTSVVSSYYDVLIRYGDQHEVLGFRDLIDVKARSEGDLDVILKNPEYAITRAIRKVLDTYQAGGNVFDSLGKPARFVGYFSPDAALPEALVTLKQELVGILGRLAGESGGKFTFAFEDPDAGDGALGAQLAERYGFAPQIASLMDPRPFWFYMMLEGDGEAMQVPLPEELSAEALQRSLEAGIQRLAPGFLKTIAVVRPPAQQSMSIPGMPPMGGGGKRYNTLSEVLSDTNRLKDTDLEEGTVPADADMLLVLSPTELSETQVFAIDQFLMQGGSVVLTTSPFDVAISETLAGQNHDSGLADWLTHMGVQIDRTMVLDPINAALPIPVQRYIGGIPIREIRMMSYPHFPDVREDGLNSDSAITAGLGQVTVNWASPVAVTASEGRQVTPLLKTSPGSWVVDDLNVLPDYSSWPEDGFPPGDERLARTIAVAVEGRFDSMFVGQESPLLAATAADDEAADDGPDAAAAPSLRPQGVIARSPASAKLVVVASNAFGEDSVLNLASEGLGVRYTKPVEFLQNVIDWSLEDQGLLAIRSRAQFARTLRPMDQDEQQRYEFVNYGLALLGLVAVWLVRRWQVARRGARHEALLAGATGA